MASYRAYLLEVDGDKELFIGEFRHLSRALLMAKTACRDHGESRWDWVVDKYSDSSMLINRRSSVAGFEPIE